MDKNEVMKILEMAKDKNGEVPMRLVRQAFEKLPESCEDTISRQAAIDALRKLREEDIEDYGCEIPEGFNQDHLDRATFAIKQLPPIQPEIVRCKDCKHWIPYDWMFSEMWQSKNMADYPEDEIGCKYCDMTMKANDFCSRGERREVTE